MYKIQLLCVWESRIHGYRYVDDLLVIMLSEANMNSGLNMVNKTSNSLLKRKIAMS